MSVDEGTARMDRLERMLGDLGNEIKKVNANGGSSKSVDRDIRSIESEFTAEELQAVRDTRAFEQFKRHADRYAEELEREAVAAQKDEADDDDADDDDDDADGADDQGVRDDAKPKPKPRAKPKPQRKPASRHAADDDDGDDDDAGDKPNFFSKLLSD